MSVSLNGTTGLTFADSSTQNTGGYTGFRNRIINGDMKIDQRNAGASVTPANGTFSVDRWKFSVSQASKLTAQQNAGAVTPPSGFTNYLGITSTSAYAITTGDLFNLIHRVEGYNTADLAWGSLSAQAVTLSFWVRSSLTGTFGGAVGNNDGTRSYPFTFTVNTANTWEYKTIVILGDTTGTWTTDNSAGITIRFGLGVGATYTGPAGSWAAASYLSATGATSIVGTSGATFYLTGVQLERGSVATPFENRPYGMELSLCQRYFETSGSVVATISLPNGPSYSNATTGSGKISFKATKRTSPTVTESSVVISQISGWSNSTPGDITPDSYSSTAVTSGSTSSYLGKSCLWSASAEL